MRVKTSAMFDLSAAVYYRPRVILLLSEELSLRLYNNNLQFACSTLFWNECSELY